MSSLAQTILITVVVFGVAFAGLAIGVIISNRRVQGSCGGLANMKDDQGKPMCMACEKPSKDCLREAEERAAEYAAANSES